MIAQTKRGIAVEPENNWLYRLGGISALLLGLGYSATIPLYMIAGTPPKGGEPRLAYLAANATTWWAILGLMVLTDFLFIPVALSLYHAMKGINAYAMRLASAFVGAFVLLDLAVTWPNYAALIRLSQSYAVDAARSIAAANYAAAVLDSPLEPVYAILTLSLGILIIGLVMSKSNFPKIAAYAGMAVGLSGILAVAGVILGNGLSSFVMVNALLATLWLFLVAYRLNQLS